MALVIRNDKAEGLAQDLAQRTGKSLDEVVMRALESLHELQGRQARKPDPARIRALLEQIDAFPDLHSRTPDEILGYDEPDLP